MRNLTKTEIVPMLFVLVMAGCGSDPTGAPGGAPTATGTVSEPSPETEESPDVSEARLEGTFSVTLEVVQTKNLEEEVGDTVQREYVFAPTCPEGPCDTDVEREALSGVRSESLEFAGADYRFAGERESQADPNCGNEPVFNEISYEVRVTAADDVEGVWRATEIEGDFKVLYSPSPGARAAGCPAGARSISEIHGTLEK
jgi:hypothetical protein